MWYGTIENMFVKIKCKYVYDVWQNEYHEIINFFVCIGYVHEVYYYSDL